MSEIWLRTNRRVMVLGMILPFVLAAVGLIVAVGRIAGDAEWARIVGWIMFVGGLILWGVVWVQVRVPRLAYADQKLFIYLRSSGPIAVPVNVVECFFWGTGTGQVPGREGNALPVRNLVIRIAEKATDYHHREVKRALGDWDGGYVTIHGAWCEPLTLEVVQRLNARLAEVQRAQQEIGKG